jgi:hypothetical protein
MTGGTKCFLLIWTKKKNAVLATLKKKSYFLVTTIFDRDEILLSL